MSFLLNNVASGINYFASQTITHPNLFLRAIFTICLYEGVKDLTKRVYNYSVKLFESYKYKQEVKQKISEMLACPLCLIQHANHVKKTDRIASEILNKDSTQTNGTDDVEKKKSVV